VCDNILTIKCDAMQMITSSGEEQSNASSQDASTNNKAVKGKPGPKPLTEEEKKRKEELKLLEKKKKELEDRKTEIINYLLSAIEKIRQL